MPITEQEIFHETGITKRLTWDTMLVDPSRGETGIVLYAYRNEHEIAALITLTREQAEQLSNTLARLVEEESIWYVVETISPYDC